MSSTSTSLTPSAFTTLIHDLPLEALYAKTAELLNSLQLLRDSNKQMEEFAEQDDVCKEAIKENEVVMGRIRERVGLCRGEVEGRGLVWKGQFWDIDGSKEGEGVHL
jgi:hypothetical protein